MSTGIAELREQADWWANGDYGDLREFAADVARFAADYAGLVAALRDVLSVCRTHNLARTGGPALHQCPSCFRIAAADIAIVHELDCRLTAARALLARLDEAVMPLD